MAKSMFLAATTALALLAVALSANAQVVDVPVRAVPSVREATRFDLPPTRLPPRPLVLKMALPLEVTPFRAPALQGRRTSWLVAEPDWQRRWPFRANPRRWPGLFANTTECSLSFDPILRRHWFD